MTGKQRRNGAKPTGAKAAPNAAVADMFAQAVSHHQAGRLAEAESLYRRIIDMDAGHADSFHCLGLIAGAAGRSDVAVALIGEAIRLRGSVFSYHNNLGIALQQQGRLDAAADSFARAAALRPDFVDAHLNLGNARKDQGRLDEAEKCFETVLALVPDFADAHLFLGNVLRAQGRFSEAITRFERALAIRPDFADARANLGIVQLDSGRPSEAEASFERALALAPDMAEALLGMGNVMKAQELPDRAVLWYERVLAIKPEMAEAHLSLGTVLHELGRMDEALECYRRAAALKPGYADACNNMGIAFKDMKQPDEAVEWFERAIALKPDYIDSLLSLGNIRQDQCRYDAALQLYRQAITAKPDRPDAHFNLGAVLGETGRLDEAIVATREAIRLEPDRADAWICLGLLVKASRFVRSRAGGQGAAADDAERPPEGDVAAAFALHRFYLDSFTPDDAGASFDAAMAALPPDLPVVVDGAGGGAVSPQLPDRMVALLHFGRSGTGLLHSLIDGHPAISTLPATYLQGFFNGGMWKRLAAEGWRHLPERFAEIFDVLFDARSSRPVPGVPGEDGHFKGEKEGMTAVGEGRDQWLSLDRERFCAEALALMAGLKTVDPASFLRVVHAAYERTLGGTADKRTMFYHIHHPAGYTSLNFMRHFPDARFVMMVREPVQSCESWLREPFQEMSYPKISSRMVRMLFDIDKMEFRRHDAVGVRLEDLKARPQATMRALCSWMGVDDDPCLYQMTAQGKKWWGDPSSPSYSADKAMDPFDRSFLDRKPAQTLSDGDRFVLRTLYYPFSIRFGYAAPDPDGFRRDLDTVRSMLGGMLDFETTLCTHLGLEPRQFQCRSDYLYFRGALFDRWNTLNRFGDYPGMLRPLAVEQG